MKKEIKEAKLKTGLDVKHILKINKNTSFLLVKQGEIYNLFFGLTHFDGAGKDFKTECAAVDAIEEHYGIVGQL